MSRWLQSTNWTIFDKSVYIFFMNGLQMVQRTNWDHLCLSHPVAIVLVRKNFANLFFSPLLYIASLSFFHFLITETHLGTQFGGVRSTSHAAKYRVGVGLEFDDIRSNLDILSFFLYLLFWHFHCLHRKLSNSDTLIILWNSWRSLSYCTKRSYSFFCPIISSLFKGREYQLQTSNIH